MGKLLVPIAASERRPLKDAPKGRLSIPAHRLQFLECFRRFLASEIRNQAHNLFFARGRELIEDFLSTPLRFHRETAFDRQPQGKLSRRRRLLEFARRFLTSIEAVVVKIGDQPYVWGLLGRGPL